MNKILCIVLIISLIMPIITIGEREFFYSEYDENLLYKYIDVPALAVTEDAGILGRIRLGMIKDGNGRIIFDRRTNVDLRTVYSAMNAVEFAETFTKEKYDYFISYDMHAQSVSGGSTGSSIASGFFSLITNKTIDKDMVITGEIDSTGNLIETGGLPLKIATAGKAGIAKIIIPPGQSIIYVNEKHDNYFITKKINLTDYAFNEFNINLQEIQNIKEILV